MPPSSKNPKKAPAGAGGLKLIATNPIARKNFHIQEIVEAGMVLTGTEVKSIRNKSPTLKEAYVQISRDMEAYLIHAHIAPYAQGGIWNHEPTRKRKLLLHKRQIQKLWAATNQKGQALVPTRLYFKKGRVKLEVGLGKGKKAQDKRQDLKKRSADREMQRALKKTR